MPVTVVRRADLEEFVAATERSGGSIVSVSPDFANPGDILVVTTPADERGVAEMEIRS